MRPSLVLAILAVGIGHLPLPAQDAKPGLRLPAILGDHMVLPQKTLTPIWGWALPGSEVVVRGSWDKREVRGRCGADGRFQVAVSTPPAGGPYEVSYRCGDATVVHRDVLVGEVWLCSGQSNMEWGLISTDAGADRVAAANHATLRLFDVGRKTSAVPVPDCVGSWQACSSESVRRFSAVGYYFGTRLQKELNVPVGLVGSNWGGTPVQAWTSTRALAKRADMAKPLADLARLAKQPELDLAELRKEWWRELAVADAAAHGGVHGSDVDADLSKWAEQAVPGLWGGAAFDGVCWTCRDVNVPADWSGQELKLALGPIDDMDSVFWNGVKIGGVESPGSWNRPRSYRIPAEMVRAGRARLAVRVVDTGGAGGMTGDAAACRLSGPKGSDPIALGGTWRLRRGPAMSELGGFPQGARVGPNLPTSLYNGMIAPLVPFAFSGAIWYQGESNVWEAQRYRTLFPGMITDWRESFGRDDLPFYFVQIAPFSYGGDKGQAAELREAQLMTLALSCTGMAVTMDVGNPRDIHPRDKLTVGHRLATQALAKTYGRNVVCEPPSYRGMRIEGQSIRLFFDHADGLELRGKAPFVIAGPDRSFVAATASVEGATVVVRAASVPSPVAVRYAWGAADEAALFNGSKLPASSFRTDSFPGVSAGQ